MRSQNWQLNPLWRKEWHWREISEHTVSYICKCDLILESYHQLNNLGFQSLFCLQYYSAATSLSYTFKYQMSFYVYLHHSVSAYRVTNIMWHYVEYYLEHFPEEQLWIKTGASGLEKYFLFNFSVLFRKLLMETEFKVKMLTFVSFSIKKKDCYKQVKSILFQTNAVTSHAWHWQTLSSCSTDLPEEDQGTVQGNLHRYTLKPTSKS